MSTPFIFDESPPVEYQTCHVTTSYNPFSSWRHGFAYTSTLKKEFGEIGRNSYYISLIFVVLLLLLYFRVPFTVFLSFVGMMSEK